VSLGASRANQPVVVFDWRDAPPVAAPSSFSAARPTTTRRASSSPEAADTTVTVRWTSPITILGLLFFVPLFSSEFFFAISRQFICGSRVLAIADLCRPVIGH